MIALLARNLALVLFLAFLVVALLEQFNPAPPPLLVDFHRADFPVCVTVPTGPIEPPKRATNLYPRRSDAA